MSGLGKIVARNEVRALFVASAGHCEQAAFLDIGEGRGTGSGASIHSSPKRHSNWPLACGFSRNLAIRGRASVSGRLTLGLVGRSDLIEFLGALGI